jgi:hypothetical protein
MIRLLQNFSSVSLHPEAAPPHGRVPADWSGKPGRKGIEQFRPKSHLTLYAWVSQKCFVDRQGNVTCCDLGRSLGQDERRLEQ